MRSKILVFLLAILIVFLLVFSCSEQAAEDDNDSSSSSAAAATAAPSSSKSITAFDFDGVDATADIDESALTIDVEVGDYHSLTALVAVFTSTGVKVEISGTEQTSGTTSNNFTSSLTYTVTAEDGTSQNYTVSASNDPYNYSLQDIGPAGGYIFYINSDSATDGWKYLESGLADLTSDTWGVNGFNISGAEGKEIGDGKQNTIDYLNVFPTNEKAAYKCDQYSLTNNGITYDDWFFPSWYEMKEMYTVLHSNSLGGFTSTIYWS